MAVTLGLLVYLAFEQGLGHYVSPEIATPETAVYWTDTVFLVNALGYVIFAVGFCLSNLLLAQRSSFAQRLYMYLLNGGYFGQYSTRALLRFWPV
jgi:hypothetical protein